LLAICYSPSADRVQGRRKGVEEGRLASSLININTMEKKGKFGGRDSPGDQCRCEGSKGERTFLASNRRQLQGRIRREKIERKRRQQASVSSALQKTARMRRKRYHASPTLRESSEKTSCVNSLSENLCCKKRRDARE